MSIAIAVFSYNQSKYILDALKSVATQTMEIDEFFIVDDGSSDNSQEIIHSFCSELNLHNTKVVQILDSDNCGLARRLNQVLSQSISDWVLWLAADDFLHPEAIKRLTSNLLTQDLAVVFGDYAEANEQGAPTGRLIPKDTWRSVAANGLITPNYFYKTTLRYTNFISGGLTLLNRQSLLEVGSYEPGRSGEDLDMMLRLGKHYKAQYVNSTVGTVRIVAESQSRNHRKHTLDYAHILGKHKSGQLVDNCLIINFVMMRWCLTLFASRGRIWVPIRKLALADGYSIVLHILILPITFFYMMWHVIRERFF